LTTAGMFFRSDAIGAHEMMAGRRTQKRGKIGRSGDVGGRKAARAAAI